MSIRRKAVASRTTLNTVSPLRNVPKAHPDRRHGEHQQDGLDDRTPDLPGVVAPEPPLEVTDGVGEGERGVGRVLAQELAQGAPSLAHVVLEQAVLRHELPDLVVVLLEDLDAAVLEVALEQPVPERHQHGAVEREGPVEV